MLYCLLINLYLHLCISCILIVGKINSYLDEKKQTKKLVPYLRLFAVNPTSEGRQFADSLAHNRQEKKTKRIIISWLYLAFLLYPIYIYIYIERFMFLIPLLLF